MKKKTQGFKPYTKNYRQGGKMGAGEAAFLRKEHTHYRPVPSGQHRKCPCKQHSMDSIGEACVCVYTYIYVGNDN